MWNLSFSFFFSHLFSLIVFSHEQKRSHIILLQSVVLRARERPLALPTEQFAQYEPYLENYNFLDRQGFVGNRGGSFLGRGRRAGRGKGYCSSGLVSFSLALDVKR